MDVQCRKLGKAVVKLTGTFKDLDLLNAAGSRDTVLLDDDMEAPQVGDQGDPEDAPRSPEAAQRGNCQDIQATKEPPVR